MIEASRVVDPYAVEQTDPEIGSIARVAVRVFA